MSRSKIKLVRRVEVVVREGRKPLILRYDVSKEAGVPAKEGVGDEYIEVG